MNNIKRSLLVTISAICAVIMIFTALPASFATDTDAPAVPAENTAPTVGAKYACLYEANSGTVIFEKDGYAQARPASTTKIMTAIVAIENTNLDDSVTIGNSVYGGGSSVGIHPGEIFTVRDLLHGALLKSGNDTARAIAIHVGGSVDGFAEMMNEKAQELNMTSTHFVNPHGVEDPDHYTSAYDMARLAAYAMQNETFRTIVGTEIYKIPPTNKNSEGYLLENTNRLIHAKDDDKQTFLYEYATGIKTGDTDAAGRCLVASAEKNGMELIAVLFGYYEDSKLGNPRFIDATALFEYGFNSYSLLKADELELQPNIQADVANGIIPQTTLNVDLKDSYICVPNEDLDLVRQNASLFSMKTSFTSGEQLQAPFNEGDVVGSVQYMYNNEPLFTANLLASQTVEENGSGNSSTGVRVEDQVEGLIEDNAWLFWVIVALLIIFIVIIISLISKRKSTQLRRRKPIRSRGMRRR